MTPRRPCLGCSAGCRRSAGWTASRRSSSSRAAREESARAASQVRPPLPRRGRPRRPGHLLLASEHTVLLSVRADVHAPRCSQPRTRSFGAAARGHGRPTTTGRRPRPRHLRAVAAQADGPRGCRRAFPDSRCVLSMPLRRSLYELTTRRSPAENRLTPLRAHGLPCMSMGFLLPNNPPDPTNPTSHTSDTPVVWRGMMVMKAVQQLLFDVDWRAGTGGHDLDVLVVDTPPGTGDVTLSLGQLVDIDGESCMPQLRPRLEEDVRSRSRAPARRLDHRLDAAERRHHRHSQRRRYVPQAGHPCTCSPPSFRPSLARAPLTPPRSHRSPAPSST